MSLIRLFSVAAIVSTAYAAPPLELKSIAGKSQKEVEALLGKPESTEKTKHGPKLIFSNEAIEIVFIKEKADWITFTPKEKIRFSKAALSALGLPPSEPTSADANSIKWETIPPFVSISAFPKPEGVDYFYIKVATQ